MIITFEEIKPFVPFQENDVAIYKNRLNEVYNNPEIGSLAWKIFGLANAMETEWFEDRRKRYEKLREMCGKYYYVVNAYESKGYKYTKEMYILLYDVLDSNHMMFYVEANNTNYEGGLSHKSMRWDDWKGTTTFEEITEEDFMQIAKDACENVLEVRKHKIANPTSPYEIKLGI